MTAGALADGGALVTGGASGIGYAIAAGFADAGVSVLIADIDGERAVQAARELARDGAIVLGCWADVTDAASLQNAVRLAESEFGSLTTVALNAGITGYPAAAMDADPDEFDRIMAVNVKGVWLGARAVVPALRRAGGGSIVITGSAMGIRARPEFGAYAASKAAANHLARVLAAELAADNIRVNALAPLAAETPMLRKFFGQDDPVRAREAFVAGVPMGRLATPADVADVAVFLSSDAARFLTGVVLPIDGGRGT
jgi:3-oxoacyl-[acyl-carrier protein] reductase